MQNAESRNLIARHRHDVVPNFGRVHRAALSCNLLLLDNGRFKQSHPLQDVTMRSSDLVGYPGFHQLGQLGLILRVS